jgi:hypothetical protein
VHLAAASPAHHYQRGRPEETTLYAVVRDNLETLYDAIEEGALDVKVSKHAHKDFNQLRMRIESWAFSRRQSGCERKPKPKESPLRSVAEARGRVESEYRAVVAWVEVNQCETAAVLEADLWRRVLALGAALFTLFLCSLTHRPRAARYEHEGRGYIKADRLRRGS